MSYISFPDHVIARASKSFLAGGPLLTLRIKNNPDHIYHKQGLLKYPIPPCLTYSIHYQLATGEFRMARYMKVLEHALKTWEDCPNNSMPWNAMLYLMSIWVRIPDNRKAEWPTLAPKVDEFIRQRFSIWLHVIYNDLFQGGDWIDTPGLHQCQVNDEYDRIINL